MDLEEYLDAATQAARRAAEVLRDWQKRFGVQEKGRFDLVTDADLASEKVIRDYLADRFPGHEFLGEEAQAHGVTRPKPDAPATWIVDPLDGTTNYVHGCPFFCVSVALALAGELVVGVVHDPSLGEVFRAGRGLGAWLNEQRIQPSSVQRLDKALLATGFPYDMRGREELIGWWSYFGLRTHGLRRT